MKNRHIFLMVLVTACFCCFCLGFLLGRNFTSGPVVVSRLPKTAAAAPSDPTQPAQTTLPVTETAPPAPTEPAQTEPAPTESGLININTATLAQLDSLPGIGPVLAQRILDYRAAHGPFSSPGQLTLVEGIGQKRLADILDLITVE